MPYLYYMFNTNYQFKKLKPIFHNKWFFLNIFWAKNNLKNVYFIFVLRIKVIK